MQTLIVHIEYDDEETDAVTIENGIDDVLEGIKQYHPDHYELNMGWRYFSSLEEAKDWEDNGFPS